MGKATHKKPATIPAPPSPAAILADLGLKVGGLGEEMQGVKDSMVRREEIVDLFKKNNQQFNDLFSKFDVDVRKFIGDQVVQGVTEGIKSYDESVKARFVTRGDMAAGGSPDPTQGTPLDPRRQAASAQGGAGGFLDFIGKLVGNAVNGTTEGSSNSVFEAEWSKYKALAERRALLDWQAFLKYRYGREAQGEQLPAGSSGHVEISG